MSAADVGSAAPPPEHAEEGGRVAPTPAAVDAAVTLVPADEGARPSVAARRSVRVADFERLRRQVQELALREAQLSDNLSVVREEFRGSRQALHGLDVLRAVARQEEFVLGRALQKVLANRLLDRLKLCPARAPPGNRPLAGRARQEQTAIVLDVLFPRSGIDELRAMLSLAYTARTAGRRSTLPVWTLHFSSASALLRALEVPVVMENMCRQFKRADGSAPARTLLERVTSEDGRKFYIVSRVLDSGGAMVASRESEQYHVRRRAYVHDLVESMVTREEVPAIPVLCPCFISWRETIVSSSMDTWEGGAACGSVTVSIPCCTMEVLPLDVHALVSKVM